MRIVCLSDTHGLQSNSLVPDGDVVIHAGDFSNTGIERDVHKFAKWFKRLPHRWKVVVAGNHDRFFQKQPDLARAYLEPDVIYLQDSGCEIGNLKFWGSPWQPWFMDWAFNLPRKSANLRDKWNLIPLDTDILITHTPPHGILDQVQPHPCTLSLGTETGSGPLGCEELAIRLKVVRPKLHIFGHIHDGYGHEKRQDTLYVNASVCDEAYRPINRPVLVEVDLSASGGHFRVIPHEARIRGGKDLFPSTKPEGK